MDYNYTLQMGRMQAMLLRKACLNAEHEARTQRARLREVPEDLRTPGWSNKVDQEDLKVRHYADLADKLWEIIYSKEPEPWEDFMESLP